eukprot:1018013-Amorphochlora_amoeboformis.AAC.1
MIYSRTRLASRRARMRCRAACQKNCPAHVPTHDTSVAFVTELGHPVEILLCDECPGELCRAIAELRRPEFPHYGSSEGEIDLENKAMEHIETKAREIRSRLDEDLCSRNVVVRTPCPVKSKDCKFITRMDAKVV